MTPLTPPLGGGEVQLWRLDQPRFAATWDCGEGSYLVGGRWSSRGVRAVYAAFDPATAIVEVAVHKGFEALDTQPQVLTAAEILHPTAIHTVRPADVPNPNWLRPGTPSGGQQRFGDLLLASHTMVLIPSAVSSQSWNLVFDPVRAAELYQLVLREPFALDTRLNPPRL